MSYRKRVLIIHPGRGTPSGMVRALQYQPLFKASRTWEAYYLAVEAVPFEWLFQQQRLHWRLLQAAIRRPLELYRPYSAERRENQIVRLAAGFDLVCLMKTPGLKLYRRLSELGRPRLLMDLNDSVWLPFFRLRGWENLESMLEEVHAVSCENDYIADFARKHNLNVFILPDSPQVEVFDKLRSEVRRDPQKITLGWIGGHKNMGPLYRILEPLEELFSRHTNLHLRIVGAEAWSLPNFERVCCSCLPHVNGGRKV